MVIGLCTFVKHPDNDEAVLVTGGQFLILFIPSHNLHCTCVTKSKLRETAHKKEANTKHTDTVLTSHVSSFLPLWPSSVWFIERLLGAARPFSLASSGKNKHNLKINYWLTDAFHSSMYRNKQFTMFRTFCLSTYIYIEILLVPGSHLCKSQVWELLKGHPLLHKRWNPDLCSKTHTLKPYCLESQSEDTTNSKANSPDKQVIYAETAVIISKKRLFKKNNWKCCS